MLRKSGVATAVAMTVGLAGCAVSPPAPSTSVLLITLDTTRADELGAYGGRARTPAFDRLAAESTLFWDASTPMATTRPAHASLMTGLPPRAHGVGDNATALPGSPAVTLAERFRAGGYRTAAFTAASVLDRSSGLDRGFDEFFATVAGPQRSGGDVAQEFADWMGTAASPEPRPLFVWVHFFDPHMPYGSGPEGGSERFDRARIPRLLNQGDLPETALEEVRRLYRSDIETMDAALDRVLALSLRAAEGRREWAVAVVADHGECFERGYYFEHGGCLYEGAIRIPLILRPAGASTGGSTDASPATLLDVGTTLLEMAGLPGVLGQGRSLLEPSAGDAVRISERWPASADALARRAGRQPELLSVAGDPVRLRQARLGQAARTKDWHLVRDPPTTVLLPRSGRASRVDPGNREAVRVRLEGLLDELAEVPIEPARTEDLDDETRRQLEALGYL